jgi:hypothetical protein
LDRLVEYDTTISTRFVHDGAEISAEVDNPAGAILRRYVRGDGADELIAWYEGSGIGDRRFLSTDERGSIVSVTDASGGLIAINSYDEYGIPGSGNVGRFQYTGQAWLPELGMMPETRTVWGTVRFRHITRTASTPPPSAGSCRPTRSDTATA